MSCYGTEKDAKTVKLAKMNLAVYGLSGDVRESNTHYEDPHTERRHIEHQVVLTRRLRAALIRLNPGLPEDARDDAIAQAAEQLARDRSKQLAVNANHEVYDLIRDGVKVTVPDEHGGQTTETLRVIDWTTPANNDFFLTSQMWVAEGLSEEELAIFDILTKPEPVLSKTEEAEARKVCRQLPEALKREKLVLDWREKQQARAAVMQTLKLEMRRLPPPFTRDIRAEKLARAYAHVYDHYFGQGRSAYGNGPVTPAR